jgi:hypothetical protein
MHFYGPLFWAAIRLTKDWMTAYSVISRTVFAVISSLVSVIAFEYWPSRKARERRPLNIQQILRLLGAAVAGPLVIVIGVGALMLVYYAPEAVLLDVFRKPSIGVCEGKIMPLVRAFKDFCGNGKVRIIHTPQQGDLYSVVRYIAGIQGCMIANDTEDLNPIVDADAKPTPAPSPGAIPNIILHADAEHHAAEDKIMWALGYLGVFHFDYGSSLPQGTEPGTAVVIEIQGDPSPPW